MREICSDLAISTWLKARSSTDRQAKKKLTGCWAPLCSQCKKLYWSECEIPSLPKIEDSCTEEGLSGGAVVVGEK